MDDQDPEKIGKKRPSAEIEPASEVGLPNEFDLDDPKLVKILIGLMKFQGSLQYPRPKY